MIKCIFFLLSILLLTRITNCSYSSERENAASKRRGCLSRFFCKNRRQVRAKSAAPTALLKRLGKERGKVQHPCLKKEMDDEESAQVSTSIHPLTRQPRPWRQPPATLRSPLWMINLQKGFDAQRHSQMIKTEMATYEDYLSFVTYAPLPLVKGLFGAQPLYVEKNCDYLIDKLRDKHGKCRRPESSGTVSDSYAHRVRKVDLEDVCWHPKHHAGFDAQWYEALRYMLQTSPSSTHTSQEGTAHLQQYFPDIHINAMTIPYESETITVDMVNVVLGQIIRCNDALLVYRTGENQERICYQEQTRPHWAIDVLLEDGEVLPPDTGTGDPLTWMITMDPGEACNCVGDNRIRERMASLRDTRLSELHFYMTSDSPFHYGQHQRYDTHKMYNSFKETMEVLWAVEIDTLVHSTDFVLMVIRGERSGQVNAIRLHTKGVVAWIVAKGDKVPIKYPFSKTMHVRDQL